MGKREVDERLDALSALQDPLRRELFRLVSRSAEPIGREAAAEALGIKRRLAAFHLDKLVDEGLLEPEFRRLTEKSGPGAGRPAKLYRRVPRELEVSFPERNYELPADLFAQGIDAARTTGVTIDQAIADAARAVGRDLAVEVRGVMADHDDNATLDEVTALLERRGYEPVVQGGCVEMRNCPFHRLAQKHTDLVCTTNLHIFEGLELELEAGLHPRLDPGAGRCCVTLETADEDGAGPQPT